MICLKALWIFIGNHSGELQTIFSAIGLILALTASIYAKKQIKLSQDQRLFELKLSILNSAYECKDLIFETKHKINVLKSQFSKLLKTQNQSLDDNVNGYDYNYHVYFEKQLELLKSPEETINKLITGLNDENHNPELNELEKYSRFINESKGGIYHALNGYIRKIDEINMSTHNFKQ